jgi:hypothetical protein
MYNLGSDITALIGAVAERDPQSFGPVADAVECEARS